MSISGPGLSWESMGIFSWFSFLPTRNDLQLTPPTRPGTILLIMCMFRSFFLPPMSIRQELESCSPSPEHLLSGKTRCAKTNSLGPDTFRWEFRPLSIMVCPGSFAHRKTQGQQLKGKIVSALFHTFSHFSTFSSPFQNFPPMTFLKIRALF